MMGVSTLSPFYTLLALAAAVALTEGVCEFDCHSSTTLCGPSVDYVNHSFSVWRTQVLFTPDDTVNYENFHP